MLLIDWLVFVQRRQWPMLVTCIFQNRTMHKPQKPLQRVCTCEAVFSFRATCRKTWTRQSMWMSLAPASTPWEYINYAIFYFSFQPDGFSSSLADVLTNIINKQLYIHTLTDRATVQLRTSWKHCTRPNETFPQVKVYKKVRKSCFLCVALSFRKLNTAGEARDRLPTGPRRRFSKIRWGVKFPPLSYLILCQNIGYHRLRTPVTSQVSQWTSIFRATSPWDTIKDKTRKVSLLGLRKDNSVETNHFINLTSQDP